ncbi:MAG: trehalose-phosphatase [Deltaproteobacteria bacterium]|nr:trehalose-phosphatase [Deltaproteobacteria bacterium]
MKLILEPQYCSVLQDFVREAAALVFDFDGTLAAIVQDPTEAFMRPSTARLLRYASLEFPCAILSGRARQDVINRIVGIPVKCTVGNHGLEWDPPRPEFEKYREQVKGWLPLLTKLLKPLRGVELEYKGFSISIHYRKSEAPERVFLAIGDAISQIGAIDIIGGKEVVNCLPHGAPTKGEALAEICNLLNCRKVVYVGDDVTDETAFRTKSYYELLGIRVGCKRDSHAGFCIQYQYEIDELLKALLLFRNK